MKNMTSAPITLVTLSIEQIEQMLEAAANKGANQALQQFAAQESDRIYTLDEMACALYLSKETIRRKCRKSELQFTRDGGNGKFVFTKAQYDKNIERARKKHE